MSNYPDDLRSSYQTTLEFTCSNHACGHSWSAPAIWDLGCTDLVNESDGVCPDCGHDPDLPCPACEADPEGQCEEA